MDNNQTYLALHAQTVGDLFAEAALRNSAVRLPSSAATLQTKTLHRKKSAFINFFGDTLSSLSKKALDRHHTNLLQSKKEGIPSSARFIPVIRRLSFDSKVDNHVTQIMKELSKRVVLNQNKKQLEEIHKHCVVCESYKRIVKCKEKARQFKIRHARKMNRLFYQTSQSYFFKQELTSIITTISKNQSKDKLL